MTVAVHIDGRLSGDETHLQKEEERRLEAELLKNEELEELGKSLEVIEKAITNMQMEVKMSYIRQWSQN